MHVNRLDSLKLSAPPGKRLVVLGDPIAHSLSPAMHNAALAEMVRKWPELGEWKYEAIHVPAADLERALLMLHEEKVVGINLTIPHKVDVLGMIQDVDKTACAMGAVNTLIWEESGYRGTNTDGYGIQKAVLETLECEFAGQDIWLFGAGGAARGIAVACLRGGCRRLTVVNRSATRLHELERQFETHFEEGLERMRLHAFNELPSHPEDNALLINATSLGLKKTDSNPIPVDFLSPETKVYDTTYGVQNQLAEDCRQRGISYADGLSMLVWQGALSLETWTGRPVPARTMQDAALKSLKERNENG